jgi:hypothetical protein
MKTVFAKLTGSTVASFYTSGSGVVIIFIINKWYMNVESSRTITVTMEPG